VPCFRAYLYTAFFLGLIRSVYMFLPGSVRYLTGYLKAEAREKKTELGFVARQSARLASGFVNIALRQHANANTVPSESDALLGSS